MGRSIFAVLSLVCILVLLIACGNTKDDLKPIQSPQGPYTTLVSSSPEEVRKRLGEPVRVDVTPEPTVESWVYPNIGLEVSVWKGTAVAWIVQTEGRITDDLQIGDSEEKVTRLLGTPVTTPWGGKSARVDTDRFSLEVHLKDGRVVSAQIMPPNTDL
jgi:hypothetical protein